MDKGIHEALLVKKKKKFIKKLWMRANGLTKSGTFFGWNAVQWGPCVNGYEAQCFSQRKNWQNFKHKTELYILYGNEAHEVEV